MQQSAEERQITDERQPEVDDRVSAGGKDAVGPLPANGNLDDTAVGQLVERVTALKGSGFVGLQGSKMDWVFSLEIIGGISATTIGSPCFPLWLARNAVKTLRAVKIVRRDQHAATECFEREFNGLQKFEPVSRTHDGLVDILTLGVLPDISGFYYVMELADRVGSRFRDCNSRCREAFFDRLRTGGIGAFQSRLLSTAHTPRRFEVARRFTRQRNDRPRGQTRRRARTPARARASPPRRKTIEYSIYWWGAETRGRRTCRRYGRRSIARRHGWLYCAGRTGHAPRRSLCARQGAV